jgi:hypothetical protein
MIEHFPIQKRLFEVIIEKTKSDKNRNWVKTYSQDMHLSKSAAYNRVNAQKSITFDDGINLMHDYQVSFLDLADGHNSKLAGGISPIQDYQSSFLHDLEAAVSLKDVQIWHFTNDLPLFILKKSRLLASFKMYHWWRNFSNDPEAEQTPFSRSWMNRRDISHQLDMSRDILKAYCQVPGVEFWDVNMFNKTLFQMTYILEIEAFEHKDIFDELVNDLMELINFLEQLAKEGYKHSTSGNAPIHIYENRIFQGNNIICCDASDSSFAYIDFGYPELFATHTPKEINLRLERLKSMPSRSNAITHSEKERRQFFRRLRHNANFTLHA